MTIQLDNLHHVLVNGADIAYSLRGLQNKTQLVFVHGSIQDFRSWRFQIEPFSLQYQTLTYSRRNHYPNEWREYPSDYSLNTERDDLVTLLRKLGLTKSPSHLIGASYGAFVCLLVARTYPELVRSLIITEPPILSMLSSKEPDFYNRSKQAYEEHIAKPLRKAEYEHAVCYFVDSAEGIGAFERLPKEIQEMMLDNAKTLLMEDPNPERDSFSCEDANQIRCPTLLVLGAISPKMYEMINGELEACLPDCSTIVIPNASHSVHSQNPMEYNAAVLKFISKH